MWLGFQRFIEADLSDRFMETLSKPTLGLGSSTIPLCAHCFPSTPPTSPSDGFDYSSDVDLSVFLNPKQASPTRQPPTKAASRVRSKYTIHLTLREGRHQSELSGSSVALYWPPPFPPLLLSVYFWIVSIQYAALRWCVRWIVPLRLCASFCYSSSALPSLPTSNKSKWRRIWILFWRVTLILLWFFSLFFVWYFLSTFHPLAFSLSNGLYLDFKSDQFD